MAHLVLHQSPNGDWYAEEPGNQGRRIDNIAGWEQLLGMLRGEPVAWDSPNSMSRFRAQFGEPPDDPVISEMAVEPQP